MIQIFHGDSSHDSRRLLQQALDNERKLGKEIITLDGDKFLPRDLQTSLQTESLFNPLVLVIENLLSRLRSRDKDTCISLISSYEGSKNIYLWDKKEITKPNLAKLPKAKVVLSKVPTQLFNLLESLAPGQAKVCLSLLHQVVESSEDIIVFTMVARQVNYLIQIKSATSPKFAPWQYARLRSQATKWSEKQLIHFHDQLLHIDYQIKSGSSKLSYLDHLDILLVSLLG
ncbi:MAG: hypothetical protein V1487_00220 [bacterium]